MTKQVNSKQICCGSENVCVWGGGGGGGGGGGTGLTFISMSQSRHLGQRIIDPTTLLMQMKEKRVCFLISSLIWVCNVCSKRDVPIFRICNVPSSCVLVFWGVRILPFLTCYSSRHVTLKTGLSHSLCFCHTAYISSLSFCICLFFSSFHYS